MPDRLDFYIQALGLACEELAERSKHLNGVPCPDGMGRMHPDCLMSQEDFPVNAECRLGGECWRVTLKTMVGLDWATRNPDSPASERA
jgi:hypothetical protein